MALYRLNPYAEMDSFRRQMDSLLDQFTGHRGWEQEWKPAAELHDDGDHLIVKLQLPGIEAKDLDITATRDSITVAGEYRNEAKGEHRSEFYYGKFNRTIGLPVAIQNNKIEADYTNGILTLTLPKVEEAVNRVVKINLGGEQKPVLEAQTDSE